MCGVERRGEGERKKQRRGGNRVPREREWEGKNEVE